MGVLVSSAVPPAVPRGEPARARERPLASSRLHPRRRRPDRDEHLRANQRKLAEHYLEDDLARINKTGVKIARDAREVSGRDVLIAGRSARSERSGAATTSAAPSSRNRRGCSRAGRRPVHGRDVLRGSRSLSPRSTLSQRRGAPDRRRDDLRRGRADARRRDGGAGCRSALRSGRRRDRREPRRRPQAALRAIEQMGGSEAARDPAQRRPRQSRRPADRLPARDARVLRGVRRARGSGRD